MENVLVTGGAGFIGSHLVDMLIRKGYRVLVVDNLSKGSREDVNIKARFEKIDIRDQEKLNNVFKEFEPNNVFHLAAISSLSSKDTQEIQDVNVFGTRNVLEACIKTGVNKIIFSSSAAVYGQALKFPTDENQRLNPISKYGISKVKSESEVASLSERSGLNYAILRFSNVYGPRQRYDNEGGVVSIFCNNIITSTTIEIYGTGEQTRDFIYIDDVIKAIFSSVKETPINFIANVSTAKEVTINNLLTLIEKVSLIKANFILKPSRDGEIDRSCLDNISIRELLGWRPSIPLLQGIENTYQFLTSNVR